MDNFCSRMSEKYYTIGAPMTALPRPTNNSAAVSVARSSGSDPLDHHNRGGSSTVRFHDCSLNASLTNLRDIRDNMVRM